MSARPMSLIALLLGAIVQLRRLLRRPELNLEGGKT